MTIGTLFIFTNNTIISSSQMNSNFSDIKTDVNAHEAAAIAHGATGAVVGTTNTQTLTNKTITSPIVTDMELDGVTLDGTTLVTLAGNQTLTNKTLDTATIDTPDLNGTITTTDGIIMPETSFLAAQSTPTANKMVNEAIIKAWGSINSDGSILASYNVESINKTGTGVYEINFKKAFSSTNYSFVVAPQMSGNITSAAYIINTSSKVTAYVYYVPTEAGIDRDFSFIAIGAQ